MPLESIGSYRLIEQLGAGAMGEVYKATDGKMFDRVVALKLLSEKFARNENARSRFQNEVQYVAHLDHPNIIKIYDHGEVDGRPFFVMEFLDGIDLARFMKEEPNRNVERCVEIGRQLCEALDFAHRHNVVHRDVKPANVMIIRRGDSEQVKLVDFGIMHVDSSKMTRDGTQPGTSAYSSPEQLRNDPVDHRSDLFSLGIVLYELFANAYPFDAPSEALITHHILQREPESPRKRNAAIPGAIDVLIMKLLEKDPSARPQTGGEVAEALRQQLRRLQSRWASTDPAEYEDLDEITREAVDKLVAWARQKEADGSLKEAVDAYEKALKLAPESDRIQRRIPKLKHRIESEQLLKEHLANAATALAGGHFPEAREQWKHAWILSPESEDVAALELRIEQAEKAVPDDREKKQFVEGLVAKSEEALDAGRLDDARAEIVTLLQRYPKDPLANFMLDRILSIIVAGVDYAAYRRSIREARDFVDAGRYSDARARCAQAQAVWPGDEEVASVERDIDQRVEGEVAALASRVEKNLLRADDPDADDKAAFELLAAIRSDLTQAGALGSAAPWIKTSSDEADRIERAVRERVERADAFRREQDLERLKRIDTLLQRGRNQLAEADVLAARVTTEPAPAIEAYGIARESFERVLQDDATHAEALEARRRIEEQLRNLAERVDRQRDRERELDSALEGARAAIAQMEVAGGARAGDLGVITALLHEADVALDRVVAIDPGRSDAVPLRARVASLRTEVLREQERRDEQAATAEKKAEQEEQRRLEGERERERQQQLERQQALERQQELDRQREQERQEAESRRLAEERRIAKQAELDRKAEEAPAAEVAIAPAAERPKARDAAKPAEVASPRSAPPPDARKAAEFEKGLAKHRRLMQQGRTREASEIQRILQSEAAADASLQELYAASFPAQRESGPRRGVLWASIAGVVVVAVLGAWFFVGRKPATESSAPPPQPQPEVRTVPDEPFKAPVQESASETQSPETPAIETPPVQTPPVEKPPVAKPPVAKPPEEKPPAKKAPAEKLPAQKPPPDTRVPESQIPTPPREVKPEVTPNPAVPAAATVTQNTAHIDACLITAAQQPAGPGFTMVFQIAGVEREIGPTDARGCATLDFEVISFADSFKPLYARNQQGAQIDINIPPSQKIHRTDRKQIVVAIR